MGIIIRVTNGPGAGRRMFLRSGQVLKVGRTEWADFCVPQDISLGEVHFALVHADGGCLVRDLKAAGGTLLNGKPVGEAAVRHGDQISAGKTTFVIQIEGDGAAAVPGAAGGASSANELTSGYQRVTIVRAAEVCQRFALADAAKPLLTPEQITREFFELLIAKAMFADAIRFLGHALPKREGVWWAIGCVKAAKLTAGEPDQAALLAAETWALDPTEDNRRRNLAAAKATKYRSPHGWAAAGAGWSEGSMAPPHFPVVIPKETMTGKAVGIAVTLAAARMDALRALPAKMAPLLELGAKVADGEDRWPEKPPGKA